VTGRGLTIEDVAIADRKVDRADRAASSTTGPARGAVTMSTPIARRSVLAAGAALLPLSNAYAAGRPKAERLRLAAERLAALETQGGGRLGVAILDTGDESYLARRADQLFPLCSTVKLLAAAAVLKRVDDATERLERRVAFSAGDLLAYAPVTKAHVAQGGMTVAALCAAAIEQSDNTAGNLLIQAIGGPAGLTGYARSLGDNVTRLDRTEPALNSAIPGDARDTTSPAAMVQDLRRLLVGDALSPASRRRLEGWMRAAKTGGKRLHAGLPAGWLVGDKTGTGENGTANVVAILRPARRAPILAAIYLTEMPGPAERCDALHAEIGRLIGETF
jgi:beta-lactamase class A